MNIDYVAAATSPSTTAKRLLDLWLDPLGKERVAARELVSFLSSRPALAEHYDLDVIKSVCSGLGQIQVRSVVAINAQIDQTLLRRWTEMNPVAVTSEWIFFARCNPAFIDWMLSPASAHMGRSLTDVGVALWVNCLGLASFDTRAIATHLRALRKAASKLYLEEASSAESPPRRQVRWLFDGIAAIDVDRRRSLGTQEEELAFRGYGRIAALPDSKEELTLGYAELLRGIVAAQAIVTRSWLQGWASGWRFVSDVQQQLNVPPCINLMEQML